MLDKNVTVDDDSQLFEIPRKKNHSDTAIDAQVLLGSDSLLCQHNDTTHRTGKKIPPSGKEYVCFIIDGETAWEAQCANHRR